MYGFSWNLQDILHMRQKNNLKNFWVVVINPLNSGSIFLFFESVIVSTIMEKRINGSSKMIHDMSGMTQEIIR